MDFELEIAKIILILINLIWIFRIFLFVAQDVNGKLDFFGKLLSGKETRFEFEDFYVLLERERFMKRF